MIQVEHLTKRYGPHTAIQDVSFEVRKGEILGFLGPNGAGKTTTMRVLSGFFPASEGKVRVAGFDVSGEPLQVKRRLGYLPENPPLYGQMTVDAYLRFVAAIKGLSRGKTESRLANVRGRCGLDGMGSRLIKHLSKGYRQRVGLAQALIHDPDVLILDEPTIGLDPKQIVEVRELIRSLAGDHTVILSTHILPEVSMTCQRIVIINAGRIVAVDTPENLTRRRLGGDRIELEVAGAPERLRDLLGKIPGIREVTPGQVSDGRVVVLVESDGGGDVRPLIARSVIESGMELFRMETRRMTLEEVFVDLTTEEEGL